MDAAKRSPDLTYLDRELQALAKALSVIDGANNWPVPVEPAKPSSHLKSAGQSHTHTHSQQPVVPSQQTQVGGSSTNIESYPEEVHSETQTAGTSVQAAEASVSDAASVHHSAAGVDNDEDDDEVDIC